MYGIADDTTASPTLPNIRGTNGATCPTGPSPPAGGNGVFVCQSSSTIAGPPVTFRSSANAVNLANKRGWYFDLPVATGRVNTNPALSRGGTLVFNVNAPTNVVCAPGGSSDGSQDNVRPPLQRLTRNVLHLPA